MFSVRDGDVALFDVDTEKEEKSRAGRATEKRQDSQEDRDKGVCKHLGSEKLA